MNRDRWLRRAQRAGDAFGLVLVLVLATYVLASLLSNRGWPAVVELTAGTATAVVALVSAHAPARLARAAIGLAVLAIALAAVAAITGTRGWLSAGALVELTLLTAATIAVLYRVAISNVVDTRTILGAISVYAILGLLFTFLYATVERLQGTSFFGHLTEPQRSDFIFFSFTTLTTTGYGNLVPAGQPGRMLSGLEMMIGQIFLVTLVARLVSLWRPGRLRERRAERSEG
jgi:Ion channel